MGSRSARGTDGASANRGQDDRVGENREEDDEQDERDDRPRTLVVDDLLTEVGRARAARAGAGALLLIWAVRRQRDVALAGGSTRDGDVAVPDGSTGRWRPSRSSLRGW